MSRSSLIAIAAAVVVVLAAFFLYPEGPDRGTDAASATAPAASDGRAAEPSSAAASDRATDLATGSARNAEPPVQTNLAAIRAIAERYGAVGAEARAEAPNDEAALDAPRIDPADTLNEAFLEDALAPEDFDAERVVAVIEASPRLTSEQKGELSRAVQVVAPSPEGRREMLPLIARVLLPQE